MHDHQRVLILALILMAALRVLLERPPRDPMNFIQSKERIAIELAEYAAELYERRGHFVRNCSCSKHACSNEWEKAQCVYHIERPDYCDSEGRLVNWDESMFRIPPGANYNDLSKSLKESICLYRHIEDKAKNYIDDSGWIFVGA